MNTKINLHLVATSYLKQYIQHGVVNMTDQEAEYFDDIAHYNDLIVAIAEIYAADHQYRDMDMNKMLIATSMSLSHTQDLNSLHNIKNSVEKIIEYKMDRDSNILLKIFLLKPDSFLKWPRFVLMIILFIAGATFVLGFFAVMVKVLMNIQYPYFYYWLIAFIIFVLICWIPVFHKAYTTLKSPE